MNWLPKNNFSRIFSLVMWGLVGVGTVILLVAAVRSNKGRRCKGMEISVKGESGKLFIDQSEVRRIVFEFNGKDINGMLISEIKLHDIESSLQKDIWILKAKAYFDNNDIFRVIVEEREPVARVFANNGNSFYIDSSQLILPLSNLFSARLPVFTGFPSDRRVLTRRDSALLKDVKTISLLIQQDSLLSALIDQVDITPAYEFEMIPKLGNQVICFGDVSNASEKFSRLLLFYKEVLSKGRWNHYSRISLKYDGQVVASLRGVPDPQYDSARANQLMIIMASQAEKMANDSTQHIKPDLANNNDDITMIQQPVERVEGSVKENVNVPADKVKSEVEKENSEVRKVKNEKGKEKNEERKVKSEVRKVK